METTYGDGRTPKVGMERARRSGAGTAVLVVTAFFVVAFVLVRSSATLSEIPGRIGAVRPTNRSWVERGKKQILKNWQKLQRFLGVDDDPLSRDVRSAPDSSLAA